MTGRETASTAADGGTVASPPGVGGAGLAAIWLAVVLVPVVVAATAGAAGFGVALVTGAGLAGIAMLLAQFVTSGRFEWVSGRIGLDVTMSFHRVAGAAVVAMVGLHVLAVPLRFGVPTPDRFLSRLHNAFVAPGNLTGVAALVLLAVIVVWARLWRGRGLRYEAWRLAHGLGAALAVGLSVHHGISRGIAMSEGAVAAIFLVLSVVAVGSLLLVYVVRPRTSYGHGFVVETVRRLTPSVVELVCVAPPDTRFTFRPGQFAWVAFGGRHTVTDNPFSIASAPGERPHLRFLIREAGDGTRAVAGMAPGTAVAVDGPHGSFVDPGGADAVVLVAGGIGMAPILSILRDAADRGDRRPYRLALAVRRRDDLAAAADLDDLSRRLDLVVHRFVEEGDPGTGAVAGRIGRDGCSTLLSGLAPSRTLAFACGPPGMMEAAVALLLDAGFPAGRIITERFDYEAARDPASRAIRRRFLSIVLAAAAGVIAVAALMA